MNQRRIEAEEAIRILDEVASSKPGSRQDHAVFQGCVELLVNVVKEWRTLKAAELARVQEAEKKAEEPELPSAN